MWGTLESLCQDHPRTEYPQDTLAGVPSEVLAIVPQITDNNEANVTIILGTLWYPVTVPLPHTTRWYPSDLLYFIYPFIKSSENKINIG